MGDEADASIVGHMAHTMTIASRLPSVNILERAKPSPRSKSMPLPRRPAALVADTKLGAERLVQSDSESEDDLLDVFDDRPPQRKPFAEPVKAMPDPAYVEGARQHYEQEMRQYLATACTPELELLAGVPVLKPFVNEEQEEFDKFAKGFKAQAAARVPGGDIVMKKRPGMSALVASVARNELELAGRDRRRRDGSRSGVESTLSGARVVEMRQTLKKHQDDRIESFWAAMRAAHQAQKRMEESFMNQLKYATVGHSTARSIVIEVVNESLVIARVSARAAPKAWLVSSPAFLLA